MKHRFIIRHEAEVDITDAAIWYQNQRSGLGEEFIAEVDAAIERVTANPRQFARLRRKPEVRRAYQPFSVSHFLRTSLRCGCRVSGPAWGAT